MVLQPFQGLRAQHVHTSAQLQVISLKPAPLGVRQDDARDAKWFPVGELPALAFDHKLVVRESLKCLADKAAAQGARNGERGKGIHSYAQQHRVQSMYSS